MLPSCARLLVSHLRCCSLHRFEICVIYVYMLSWIICMRYGWFFLMICWGTDTNIMSPWTTFCPLIMYNKWIPCCRASPQKFITDDVKMGNEHQWHTRLRLVSFFCIHIWHHLWSITCPWQGFPPAFLQTSKICHYPFMILDWERHWEKHCESEVLYPRTQHIDVACTQTCTSQPRVQYNDQKATASPTDIKFVVRTKK